MKKLTKPLVHYTVLVSEVTISKLQNTLLLFKIVRVSIDSAIIMKNSMVYKILKNSLVYKIGLTTADHSQ